MRLLFDAGGSQLLKVRAITALSILCAIASIWFGLELSRTYGLAPGDGGKLQPSHVRWAVGGLVASLGIAFAFGMEVYGRCYVRLIELDPQSNMLHVHTLGVGTVPLVLDRGDVFIRGQHAGRLDADISVDAPWLSLGVRGRSTPLIVDEQGVFHDRATLLRFLKS